jgi:hypothetical protein
MPVPHPQYVATGNILPYSFIKGDGSVSNGCAQATDSTAPLLGITAGGTKYPPQPEISNVYGAEAGDGVRASGQTDVCRLTLGGNVTAMQLLTATAGGAGVAVSAPGASNQYYGARALQSGNSGDVIEVEVLLGVIPHS